MVELVCQGCGEEIEVSVLEGTPQCEHCGSTDFEPSDDGPS